MNAGNLVDALREAEPALWIMAASGNKDAVRIHKKILAALAEYDAQPAQAAQPVGVPDEPTAEMLVAARDWSAKKYGKPIGDDAARGCWQAMRSAAPQPPAQPSADAEDAA